MPVVEINNVGEVEFPDTMSPDEIQAAIERDILPSKAGSFLREAARSIIPAAAGIVAAPFATAASAPAMGPAAPAAGVVGGIATATGVRKAQDALADKFFPNSFMGTKSAQLDAATNPVSSILGGATAGGRPSLRNAQSVAKLLTAEGRQLAAQGFRQGASREAADMASRLTNVGVSGGVNAGISIARGGNAKDVARDAAVGMVFSRPWIRGSSKYETLHNSQTQEIGNSSQSQDANGMPSVPVQRGPLSSRSAPSGPINETSSAKPTDSQIVNSGNRSGIEEVRSPVRELPPSDSLGETGNPPQSEGEGVIQPPPVAEPYVPVPRRRSSILTPNKEQLNALAEQEAAKKAKLIASREEKSSFKSDPLVDFIRESGGLRSKTSQIKNHGGIRYGAGEYDSATRLRDNSIYSPHGIEPDIMAQMAYDKGLLPEGATANDLWIALDRVNQNSKRFDRQSADYEEHMAQQEAAAMERLKNNGYAHSADDLSVGQVLFVPKAHGGGRMRVVDISPEGDVTLMMPDKSTQTLPAGAKIMVSGTEDGIPAQPVGEEPF